MIFKKERYPKYLSGTLIAIFSLKSKDSIGCGDFYDLLTFANYLKECNLNLIQILPINDTGTDSSPYNALSSCALHPIYLRIEALKEYQENKIKSFLDEKIKENKEKLNQKFIYKNTYDFKMELLNDIFNDLKDDIIKDKDLNEWIACNDWVIEYACFKNQKDLNNQRSWLEWDKYKDINLEKLKELFYNEEYSKRNYFYAWIQYITVNQLKKIALEIDELNMILKGDIPILINEDSSDLWLYKNIFSLDKRAGTPPDRETPEGQNWGFPVYNWSELKKSNYSWYKRRLKLADEFYHSYRIDHVLGFFRLWNIDYNNYSGMLGVFNPYNYFKKEDFNTIGFNEDRIKWLAEPHISINQLYQDLPFNSNKDMIIKYFFIKIANEDLFLFKKNIRGEKDIIDSPFNETEKSILLNYYRDRVFIKKDDEYYTSHFYYNCSRLKHLNDTEKNNLENLININQDKNDFLWQKQGSEVFDFITKDLDMLICAEDLGGIPNCVPKVLKDFNILSLKIPRWTREWDKKGSPFIKLEQYPYLSVCAVSVHDTSTLRIWIKEAFKNEFELRDFYKTIDLNIKYDLEINEKDSEELIKKILQLNTSMITIFQFQDFLLFKKEYLLENEDDERMNKPGTVGNHNWTYQIKDFDTLINDTDFKNKLKTILSFRKR